MRVRAGEAMKWSCSLDQTEAIARSSACTFCVGGARTRGLTCSRLDQTGAKPSQGVKITLVGHVTSGPDLANAAPCSNSSVSDYANPASCKLSTLSRSRDV